MARAPSRTNFNRSKLIRSLAGLSLVDVAEPSQSLAERLSPWLGVTDAITVFAALHPSASRSTDVRPGESGREAVTLREELAQTRTALANSMTAEDICRLAGKARIQLPPLATTAVPEAPFGGAVDFLPYRRYYLAQQRAMASSIGLLRTKARESLSRCSPKLKQLADLDAALDQALIGREQDLLATVPVLLEKRFLQLRQAHQQALSEAQQPDDPDSWPRPGGWLALFGKELRDVLLAELELRLQPVTGLIEAHSNQVTTHQ